MFEHARRRRDADERVEDEPVRPAPPAPSAATILALQATAGNRAVIQRLMYHRDGTLTVPATFASQKAKWNETLGYVDEAETTPETSLYDLWPSHKVKSALEISMAVDYLKDLRSVADQDLAEEAKRMAAVDTDEELTKALSASAVSHTRLILEHDQPFDKKSLMKSFKLLPAFANLLPEKPDLPPVGQSVRGEIPGTEDREGKRKSYWTLVCVLIALYKNEGAAKASKIVGRTIDDDRDTVVQALHDHYVGKNFQYDDTATRMSLMQEWGYRMVFTGDVPWSVLPQHVGLLEGRTYIVDIEDHAFKMTVEHDLPKQKAPVEAMGQYVTCHSEKDNYSTSEFLKNVHHVWLRS